MIELTEEQKFVAAEILKFKTPIVKVGGLGGCGKSTIVGEIRKELKNFAFAAFTGKAANVLRQKGILEAQTIHSLIYKPRLDKSGNLILDKFGSPIFDSIPFHEFNYDGIIIDEASMVNKELFKDICTFDVPTIFVGDHGQLEPIGESINLMKNPDYKLEKIHRNAGEIAFFAQHIRLGYTPASYKATSKVFFVNKNNAEKYFAKVDQIICAFNKTRVNVNINVRKQLGYTPDWPVVGERLMCLKNDKEKGLFNGMQGTIKKIFPNQKNKIVFESDGKDYEVFFDPSQLNKEKYDFEGRKDDPTPFDYCYAISAHKSQGSEWDNVMVLEQKCKMWEHSRWAYTAATRAKKNLVWVSDYYG